VIAAANVRPLHPMRILLVTDDERFAGTVSAAAEQRGLYLARATSRDDLDRSAKRDQPNVVALDARRAPRRTARTATAFAGLHPRIAVVVVADRAHTISGLRLVDKSRPPENLLEELERAYLGLRDDASSRV
jgi:DNA-binding response OmpR family regulator